jgi:hypothetical protein
MVKCVERKLTPDDLIFKGGPQVFTPIARPPQAPPRKTPDRLLDELKDVGEVKRGTVERSLLERLEREELPKRRR